ncbi:putative selenate ABC transporter substrate-binding protein [Limimaricola hongkongensis]|uniref:Phosphonate ABC transporter phosphate-binding periplasmic component n=1 Tax=Limimaricola hongkongensis DSM 17492 TaxID=1122180 RepID=A0A017HDW6_9RHOB|nr:putative selenate ABC transporter substrate-binding protein [Limimaricola hongkongensis]EYD71979.1 Phosphonate ABC transporter phosphate-binding periplasmic component [Limimaricola hongkongensis DSM 17492]
MTIRLSHSALALGLLIAAALPATAQDAPTLYFSAIPDDDETKLEERFDKVADYLEETLGVPVDYVPVKDYAASVTAFRNDQIQLAWFGGLSGVQARRLVPGSRAIAQGAEDEYFISYIIANTGTGITATGNGDLPEAIGGRSFTFGAQGSTSGRLMPEYFLREITGKAPDEIFSDIGYSGDHGQTMRLVASGAYDLGALNYSVYDTAVAEAAAETETTDVIWRSPPYPDYNWTIRGDVDARWGDGFADRVQAALIGIDDAELLASFPRSAFIASENALYAPIEETARELDLID